MYMRMASRTKSFANEMIIRKKIAKIFNKREEHFASLRGYNDYLEQVEDMTFNLIEGIDVAAIEAKIEKYRRENAEQIANTEARKAEELAAALAGKGSRLLTSTTNNLGVQTCDQYEPATIPAAQPAPVEHHARQHYAADSDRAASAGGWSVNFSKKRALEEAFSCICTQTSQYFPDTNPAQPVPVGCHAPQNYATDYEVAVRAGGRSVADLSKKRALEEAFSCICTMY